MLKLPPIDTLSFWIGFFIASLFWLIISGLRQAVKRLISTTRERNQQRQQADIESLESILLSSVVKRAQKNHMASLLFPLDAVLITPTVFIPFPELSSESLPDTLLPDYIPYLPHFPQVTADFGYPRCLLIDVMKQRANICVVGGSGSGKTVALADIATKIARRDPCVGEFHSDFPIYLHILDLNLDSDEQNPEALISDTLCAFVPEKYTSRVLPFITHQLESNTAILILDGLDELPPELHAKALSIISGLLSHYPMLPVLITAHPNMLGNSAMLGFVPVLIAPWNSDDKILHHKLWHAAWNSSLADGDQAIAPDPHLIEGLQKVNNGSPFIRTISMISLYTGFGKITDEASLLMGWLDWVLEGRVALPALRGLASYMVSQSRVAIPIDEAARKLQKPKDMELIPDPQAIPQHSQSLKKRQIRGKEEVIEYLMEHGLLRLHPSGQVSFTNPLLVGLLALPEKELVAKSLSKEGLRWVVIEHILQNNIHMILREDISEEWISFYDLPLLIPQLCITRNLSHLPDKHPLRERLLSGLVPLLLDDTLPFITRVNLIAAIVESKEQSLGILFRKLLTHKSNQVIRLATLGLGLLKDNKSLPELAALIESHSTEVAFTSTIAIAAMGTPHALKILVEVFLNGEENHRRLVAELFATGLMSEGYEILKEGTSLEDIITRRAAVFGLASIRSSWANDLLERIVVEDSQWVVRNAAGQALESHQQKYALAPKRFEKPWLVESVQDWARKKGESLAPGEFPAIIFAEMVQKGNLDEQRLALQYLSTAYFEPGLLAIYNILYGDETETVQNQAIYALWKVSIIGNPIPPPRKYGLG